MSLEIITDAQAQAMISSLAMKRGKEGFTEQEAHKIVNWANEVLVFHEFFKLIVKGYIAIDVIDGEVCFSLTKAGNKALGPRNTKIQKYLDELSEQF
jgi:hypothetical protein